MILYIDYQLCEGCGACADMFPGLFEMRDDLAWVSGASAFAKEEAEEVERCCPFHAIFVE